MWAHYADNHQGVVIEFDFDQPFFMDSLQELDGRKSRFGKSHLGDIYEFPQKVNYRREMPKFERPEFVNPDSITEFHWKKFNHVITSYSIHYTKLYEWYPWTCGKQARRSGRSLRYRSSLGREHTEQLRA